MAYVSVDIDLYDIDSDELIDELESRGYKLVHAPEEDGLLNKIYLARRMGKPYDHLVDALIYESLGKVI